MSIWVLSDPHLAFSVPEKTMEAFGPSWEKYTEKIHTHWQEKVAPEDLVLLPGDISWAMHLKEALIDLEWLDSLKGTKLILRGNHDYWWSSSAKLKQNLPSSLHFIHNNVFIWKKAAIGGARLWDTSEYSFHPFITFQENSRQKQKKPEEIQKQKEEDEKIFIRELERLKLSLSQIPQEAKLKIAMTHYPPIGADLKPSRASHILESFHIDLCVFGHLHNVCKASLAFGKIRGVEYKFTSCDYLDFTPLKIVDASQLA